MGECWVPWRRACMQPPLRRAASLLGRFLRGSGRAPAGGGLSRGHASGESVESARRGVGADACVAEEARIETGFIKYSARTQVRAAA
eukprot:5234740-Pleurochrysis_carterae.AAC.1